MPWDFALILIFLGVAVPLLGRRRVRQLLQIPSTTKEDRLRLYASTMAFQWLASGVILWRSLARGISTAQMGLAFPRPVLTFVISIVLVSLIFLNQLVGVRRLSAKSASNQGTVPQLAQKLFPQDAVERLAFFALVVTVALCEEFIYRGFVQNLFQTLAGGSAYFAVFGSAAFFSLAHLYQGRRGLISTFVVGLLFSAATAVSLSLIPAVAAHFVADFTAGMLAPKYLKRAMPSTIDPSAAVTRAESASITIHIV
ncbi:MAG TPA: CPBP family intramembrane glutamic endopeptidase [Candidatus Acidoferrales bacterium]